MENNGNRSDTTLGELLIKMRFLTVDQLAECLHKQLDNRELLGQLLLKEGVLKENDLTAALEVQEGLRSSKKHIRALTMARLSEMSGQRVKETAEDLKKESWRTKQKLTTRENPAITKEMITERIILDKLKGQK